MATEDVILFCKEDLLFFQNNKPTYNSFYSFFEEIEALYKSPPAIASTRATKSFFEVAFALNSIFAKLSLKITLAERTPSFFDNLD